MHNFINKKSKNVRTDRFRGIAKYLYGTKVNNEVKMEEIAPNVIENEVINPEVIIKEDVEDAIVISDENIETMAEEAKPKKRKNVKIENKENKIED